MLRRVEFSGPQNSTPVLRAGDLEINFVQQSVSLDGNPVHLTATEYRTLCELAGHAGKVLLYDHLLDRVWGPGYEGQSQLVRQVIHRLRAKIEFDPGGLRYIQTKVGVGYMFVIPES